MPFKDVDLKRLDEKNKVHKSLYNKIAEINKLTSSTIKDDNIRLPTVELISGKKVKPIRENPVSIIQARLDAAERTKPVTDKLQRLSDQQEKSLQYQDLMAHQQMAMLEDQIPDIRVLPPEEAREIDIAGLEGIDLDDETMTLLKQRNPMYVDVNEVFAGYEQSPDRLIDLAQKVTRDLNVMKGEKGNLTKSFRKSDISEEEYNFQKQAIDEEYAAVKKYHETLKLFKRVLVREGVINIGDYWVNKKKLNRDNILSVRYNNNNNMVGRFGAKKVSDNVKKVVNNDRIFDNVKLSQNEKRFLDKLYLNSGTKISPSKAQLIRGGEVFTSLKEMSDKLKIIMGQIKAGNTSKVIRNEAMDILHYLFKNKKIKTKSYKEIINFLSSN
jgi:hypothetical protein